MKVRFTRSEGLEPGALQGAGALKPGEEYVVLEVFSQHGKDTSFRMEYSPRESCAVFDSRLFTITSAKMPPSWIFFQLASGSFSLCPEPWSDQGFWEAFYDREQWAVAAYETEKQKILAVS
ncbi:hypothetical protein [Streptomyces sp. NBC_01803]|uniref:hypothetical protein n=1 Tax=Streptomyces sp. NBC_01803 TaxID=2975946 RepID=UPI002DDA3132|nr:hypothetical protein [Streptomyces sp. NBC_01803]WSA44083.1 hypothetical protein OIE51_07625 [Streptomyces sp. NBC_01803]